MTIILGHRGAAGTCPENTMISFMEAEKLGAQGIELDVQMSKDGKVVVIHDETIDRTTNGKGAVKDYTYEEIKRFDASYKFKDKVGFCSIPTLQEVLQWLKENDLILNIELKNNKIAYRGLEEEVITLVRKHEMENRVILSSFNHFSMMKCHQLAPDIETAILYKQGLHTPWAYAKKMGASAIHPNYKYIPDSIIVQSLENQVAVRPYTVNGEKKMRELMALNVSAIVTDFPEKAKRILEETK
jgi:glycerophosphoryl diester phosphodiesterase